LSNIYFVKQAASGCTEIKKTTIHDTDEIHAELGLLPLITPYLNTIFEHNKTIAELKTKIDHLDGNIKYFILTEDENSEPVKNYFEANEYSKDATSYISFRGCNKITEAFLLGEYLLDRHKTANVVIHIDQDYNKEDEIEHIRKRMSNPAIKLFITKGVDIESEYLNAAHINSLYPQISIDEINKMIDEATDESENDSISKMLNVNFNKDRDGKIDVLTKIQEIRNMYNNNKHRYRYGKKVIGLLKSKLQKRLKLNPNIYQVSYYLKDKSIEIMRNP
jgi:hypothetical protein